MNLELKIPPPVILFACGLLAWVVANGLATPLDIAGMASVVLSLFFSALGVGVAISAVLGFRRAKTTIDPLKPDATSTLVTSGIFRLSRNPMYVALLLVLTGWISFLGSVAAIAVLILFVVYISRFQIRPEERILSAKFGVAYTVYCSQVRRWI